MQLNKLVKNLFLVLPILAIAACSSKNNSGISSANEIAGSSTSGTHVPRAGDLQSTLQELKRTNIVYFGFDRYDITPEYAQILDSHAAFLRNHPEYKIVIEGHADERGTPEYNIALGERRANAVKMYLQGKGVPVGQLSIVSYGSEKPAVLGHTEAAYAKNRRAILDY